jgi:ABC-type Zn uptake system ZnuABC Zn-binding protein ZnuA
MSIPMGWRIGMLALCGLLAVASRAAEVRAPTVLTGMQATYSIASALARDTPIQVRNIPADGRELALQKDYIERRAATLAPVFAAATAVITITNAWPEDPLYRFAREANIRIVNIDAAVPWSTSIPGVALADRPVSSVDWAAGGGSATTGTAPYFWLGISNAIRMADIVAHDLAALFPESATTIARNLDQFKRSLLDLRAAYQGRLIESGADVVFALTGDFVYLTNDMGLLVDGYLIRQDAQWTAQELAGLTRHLREHGIQLVLHRWMPAQAIQDAIRAGGARLVVLEAGDPGVVVDGALAPDGLQRILRGNLEAVAGGAKSP